VLATVYLGWHFAVDDVVGLVLAWVSVQLGRLTVWGRTRNPPAEPATA
jgi:membrane-associated phospholipid phosphatase